MVARLRKTHPGAHLTYRDLAEIPIPHLTGAYLAAAQGPGQPDAALQANLELGRTVLKEFLAADIVVVGVAFYNFSIASQLKAWVLSLIHISRRRTQPAKIPRPGPG